MNKWGVCFAFFFVIVFLGVVFVSAEQAPLDKCPLERDGKRCNVVDKTADGSLLTLQGICYNTACINLEAFDLKFDEQYIKDTIKDRLFDPQENGMTLFDNYVCEAHITGTDEQRAVLRQKGINAKLNTIDGTVFTQLKTGVLEFNETKILTDKVTDKQYKIDIYRWKITGWPNGLNPIDQAKMEIAVKNKNLRCDIVGSDNKIVFSGKEKKTTNCVQLYGKKDAYFPFVYLKTQSSGKTLGWLNSVADESINSFNKVDPFAKYPSYFSHSIDLEAQDDSSWQLMSDSRLNFDSVKKSLVSSCKKQKSRITFILTNRGGDMGGYTRPFFSDIVILSVLFNPLTPIHEAGHAFCGLSDEGVYPDQDISLHFQVSRNCRRSGLAFGKYGSYYPGCTLDSYFRSSYESLMSSTDSYDNRLNVIGCGYCLKEILKPVRKGTENSVEPTQDFETCLNNPSYDVIRP